MAVLTLQVLMHRSDLLTISIFIFIYFFVPPLYIHTGNNWYPISEFTLIPGKNNSVVIALVCDMAVLKLF